MESNTWANLKIRSAKDIGRTNKYIAGGLLKCCLAPFLQTFGTEYLQIVIKSRLTTYCSQKKVDPNKSTEINQKAIRNHQLKVQ